MATVVPVVGVQASRPEKLGRLRRHARGPEKKLRVSWRIADRLGRANHRPFIHDQRILQLVTVGETHTRASAPHLQ